MREELEKLIILDTETTGLNPGVNGLIQVAGAVRLKGRVVETFDIKCRPFPSDVVADDALAAQGRSIKEVEQWQHPQDAYMQLVNIMSQHIDRYDKTDKFGFVAYNAKFDADHLRSWFMKCDQRQGKYFGSWFWHPPFDLMSTCGLLFGQSRIALPNFKLGTVCEYLGIQPDGNLHDAAVDVDLTVRLYERMVRAWFGADNPPKPTQREENGTSRSVTLKAPLNAAVLVKNSRTKGEVWESGRVSDVETRWYADGTGSTVYKVILDRRNPNGYPISVNADDHGLRLPNEAV